VACGDRQVTYAELDERTSRLAHHLAGLGVGPGDHVGLYARNSIEALETLIASCKLRASAVNINYRYVENELHYMLADADLTALVYDRRLAPRVAASAHAAPGLRGLVEIDDGSEANPETTATDYNTALKAAAPDRDFPPRSNDDVYIIYTGGTTGYPKGVMWRHEDIWRTLGGGIDFITGDPLSDEWAQSRKGLEAGEFVKLCAAPLRRACSPARPSSCCPPSTQTRSGEKSPSTRSTCWSSSATRWPGRWSRPTCKGITTPPRWSPCPPAPRYSPRRSRTPAPGRCPTP
jgi:acyl-CoA synthetase (AMP-forming)/AMP-acid ligase II